MSRTKKIKDFIKKFESEYLEIDKINTEKAESPLELPNYVLDFVGSDLIGKPQHTTYGEVHITRQDNYNLQVARYSDNEIYRDNMSNFMTDFILWVDEQNALGLTPKFSNIDTVNELCFCTGGISMGFECEEASFYVIQLHFQYTNIYKGACN